MTRLIDLLICILVVELIKTTLKKCTNINQRIYGCSNIKYKTDYFKEYEYESDSDSESE